MAKINRNRLHLLVSGLFALVAIVNGVNYVRSAYPPFAEAINADWNIRWIEQTTKKPYAQWVQEQNARCANAKSLEDYRPCLDGANARFVEPLPESEVIKLFLTANKMRLIALLLSATLVSWLLGFLLVKGIPAGLSRFWAWLTATQDKR